MAIAEKINPKHRAAIDALFNRLTYLRNYMSDAFYYESTKNRDKAKEEEKAIQESIKVLQKDK